MTDEPKRKTGSEPCVWVSDAQIEPGLGFGFTCQLAEDDNDLLVARIRAFKRGEALEPADLPPAMWISPRFAEDDRRKLPHLFSAGGYFTVSEPFAEVLRGFDLGRTRLHPVELLHLDRETPFPGRYYFLNIAEVHRHFSPELSARWEPYKDPKTSYLGSPPLPQKDDDLTVAPAALDGPAIWLDDTIGRSLFFSDPLVRALRAAKLTGKLPLYRCRVATMN